MEEAGDDARHQQVLAQFVEVVGESEDRSRPFLEATNWQLEDAIQLFFAGGSDFVPPAVQQAPVPQLPPPVPPEEWDADPDPEPQKQIFEPDSDDYVRPPLPVKREALYEDIFHYRAQRRSQRAPSQPMPVDAFRNFEDEYNSRVSAGSSAGTFKAPTLATLYRPPLELIFEGTFEQAKAEAAKQGKWLLVNVQSNTEFASHMLNRDTWSHEAVKDTVGTTFIFWQIYDDTEEGRKVCTYYRLNAMPTILVLDPLTGLKMRAWEGMVGAERLLEDLVQFMDKGPMESHQTNQIQRRQASPPKVAMEEDQELQQALAASLEGVEPMVTEEEIKDKPAKPAVNYPVLPEVEPASDQPESCRVGIRFPDGKRGQRRYLLSDPLSYLWSYCCANVKEAKEGRKFRLTHTVPGTSVLEFDPNKSVGQAGVANTMLVMAWD